MDSSRLEQRARILIVDDNEDIHTLMRNILAPPKATNRRLDELSAALFDDEAPSAAPTAPTLLIDSAFQGEEAIQCVRDADRAGDPYILLFMDVRMPPGIDGIQALKQIWLEFPDIYSVICTAYSDYSWQAICDELAHAPNLLILRKPFEAIEVQQIVSSVLKMYNILAGVKAALQGYEEMLALHQRQVAVAQARLSWLADAAADGILFLSATGVVEEANTSIEALLRTPRAQLIGSAIGDVVPVELPAEGTTVSTARARTVTGEHVDVEVHVARVDGAAGDAPTYLCIARPVEGST